VARPGINKRSPTTCRRRDGPSATFSIMTCRRSPITMALDGPDTAGCDLEIWGDRCPFRFGDGIRGEPEEWLGADDLRKTMLLAARRAALARVALGVGVQNDEEKVDRLGGIALRYTPRWRAAGWARAAGELERDSSRPREYSGLGPWHACPTPAGRCADPHDDYNPCLSKSRMFRYNREKSINNGEPCCMVCSGRAHPVPRKDRAPFGCGTGY